MAHSGNDRSSWAVGGGLLLGLGIGFFFLPESGLAFVGSILAGLGFGLVLSAIVFSTAGVLLGLLITGQPFGIVMVGLGIIALAGIVVNNNIVLIDTYNHIRRLGKPVGSLCPVLLETVTTICSESPSIQDGTASISAAWIRVSGSSPSRFR